MLKKKKQFFNKNKDIIKIKLFENDNINFIKKLIVLKNIFCQNFNFVLMKKKLYLIKPHFYWKFVKNINF